MKKISALISIFSFSYLVVAPELRAEVVSTYSLSPGETINLSTLTTVLNDHANLSPILPSEVCGIPGVAAIALSRTDTFLKIHVLANSSPLTPAEGSFVDAELPVSIYWTRVDGINAEGTQTGACVESNNHQPWAWRHWARINPQDIRVLSDRRFEIEFLAYRMLRDEQNFAATLVLKENGQSCSFQLVRVVDTGRGKCAN